MTFLCLNCQRDKFEYSIKKDHLPDLGNKIKKYTINKIEFNKVDEILNNYITIYNKEYDSYFINCEFKIQFEENFCTYRKTNYVHNIEIEKINQCLFFCIEFTESKVYNFL